MAAGVGKGKTLQFGNWWRSSSSTKNQHHLVCDHNNVLDMENVEQKVQPVGCPPLVASGDWTVRSAADLTVTRLTQDSSCLHQNNARPAPRGTSV